MAFLGKPVGGTGIHRYYGDGYDRPNRFEKAWGHRAARRAWDAEIEATEASDYFWVGYEERDFMPPRPIDIGYKP